MSLGLADNGRSGCLDNDRVCIRWAEAPWDTAALGSLVLQITRFELRGKEKSAAAELATFESARDRWNAHLVSCRLLHDSLRESMLLEEHGFRFIEMVYQPELEEIGEIEVSKDRELNVGPATGDDLPALLEIASSTFRNERFHMDPRIGAEVGDRRYANWVKSAWTHERQRLHVLRNGGDLVGFFFTELLSDGTCYWHLNAVSPGVQGQGCGRRAWLTMMKQATAEGAHRIQTCIAARNHRVLNLYAGLGFRFGQPSMTFHWVRRQSGS